MTDILAAAAAEVAAAEQIARHRNRVETNSKKE